MSAFSFTENSINQPSDDDVLQVLTYELGDIVKCQYRSRVYGPEGFKSEQKQAFADLISMVRLFCEKKGWDFEELMRIGEEHYLERMNDLRKYGKGV